jgi:hypothetical protein
LANVNERAAQLTELLDDHVVDLPEVAAVRQAGMMVGIELAPPPGAQRWGRRVSAHCVARGVLIREPDERFYVYRQVMGTHSQTGLVACCHIEDYAQDIVRKHEKTRKDKEDDRTRHCLELNANSGPVFLTYRGVPVVDRLVAETTARAPLYDFTAVDGIRHTVWRVETAAAPWIEAFAAIPHCYVADGHHRAAAAESRLRDVGDGESKRRCRKRVHGIAALRQHRRPGGGGIGMRGGDHTTVALHALPRHRRDGGGRRTHTPRGHGAGAEARHRGRGTSGMVKRETRRQRHALWYGTGECSGNAMESRGRATGARCVR